MEFLSLKNEIYGGPQTTMPEIGMGVTILSWTDRYAGTVI
jgi:hypothetical protein